jgi:hypothetical protein
MQNQAKPPLKKAYHPPEVKDYGNISKITAGTGGGHPEGVRTRT